MPAYRSDAEAEIREAVVARIRASRPEARIIHEINCAGQGTNRIDLIAVGREEIVAVEIKSSKDKIDRLPAQIYAYTELDKALVGQRPVPSLSVFIEELPAIQWQ